MTDPMTTPILTEAEIDAMYVECHKGLSIDRHKFADLLAAAVLAKLAAMNEPLFWVRLRSDGGFEGPIHNDAIEDVRKRSGAWLPLVVAHPPAAQDRVPVPTNEEQAAAMTSIGIAWLTQHAPHRLRKEQPAAQDRKARQLHNEAMKLLSWMVTLQPLRHLYELEDMRIVRARKLSDAIEAAAESLRTEAMAARQRFDTAMKGTP
jgi:hypothetical protein